MLGLFTRWAAYNASGEMSVAYWLADGTRALLPIQNQSEPAVLYCFVFLFIAAHGPLERRRRARLGVNNTPDR